MIGAVQMVACLGIAACAWFTEPSAPRPRAEAQTQQDPSGCRKVRFTIVGDTAVTGVYPDTSCQMQLELIAAGAMSWSGDTVAIPFRLRNRSASSVLLPVRLEVRDSGIVALEPAEAPTADVVALNMDSTLSGGRNLWLVGGGGALAAGDSTGAGTLLFRVEAPVTEAAFAFELVGHEGFVVAMMPPDFQPAWFTHDSSYRGSGTLKRALQVDFTEGSTLNQRIAAVSAVRGTVIGGTNDGRGGEQSYYIGLPWAFHFDSLVSALDILENNQVVRFAGVVTRLAGHGRRPADGTGWAAGTWNFSPDLSSGNNWASEEIALPLAWGCETGSAAIRVGVLDLSFSHGDFSPFGGFPSTISLIQPDHGNLVTSVLASVGDNSLGMAGVTWQADLRLEAIGSKLVSGTLRPAIMNLIEQEVRVINLSLAPEYEADDDEAFRMASTVYHQLVRALEMAEEESLTIPLLIVAAGNDNRSADYAGAPLLRTLAKWDTLVTVVGASGPRTDSTRSRWGGSSFAKGQGAGSGWGSLVDVYAPGQSVNVWNARTSSFNTVTGTSIATPHVAGIAALLFSFDPSLTAAEVKQLILQGAINGGRTIENDDTRYLANAYESLKLAARKPGTPLCGNRVWSTLGGGKNKVYIERDGTDEMIYERSDVDTLSTVFPAHGGRQIFAEAWTNSTWPVYLELNWTGSVWSATTLPDYPDYDDSVWSGTTWSFYGRTHDGDSVATPQSSSYGGLNGPPVVPIEIRLGAPFTTGRLLGTVTPSILPTPTMVSGKRTAITDSLGDFVSYVESTAPIDQIPATGYEAVSARAFPSPASDHVLLVLNFFLANFAQLTAWAPCPDATPIGGEWSCQHRGPDGGAWSTRVEVWTVPWAGGTAQLLWNRPDRTIGWLGLAEESRTGFQQAVMGIGESSTMPFGFFGWFDTCAVEYVNIWTGTALLTPRAADPVLNCHYMLSELGTLAPAPPAGTAPIVR